MTTNEQTRCLALLAGFPAGLAVAAPDEGDGFRNIAALLVLLGIGALLMGLRNLRGLRHKRLMHERRNPDRAAEHPEDSGR